jgi:8-oxo-dGTP pyrophosphatase MutT (NUDIX family)
MRIRPSARVLVLDPQQRVLLFHIHDHYPVHRAYPAMRVYWCTPGGGVEPGETAEHAAQRELWEETGIQVSTVGPCVWYYERVLRLPDGSLLLLQEHIFFISARTAHVSVRNMLPYEHTTHRAYRWWSLADLARSAEHVLPPGLPRLLPALVNGDIPTTPIHLSDH